jgi:hypothetical protein
MADLFKKIDDAGKGRSGNTGPSGSSRGFSPPLCGEWQLLVARGQVRV